MSTQTASGPALAGANQDLAAAHADLEHAIKSLFAAMRRMKGRETHQHGQISFAQFGLLIALDERSPLSCRELASAAQLTPGTVTQMLEGLEASGLVQRARSDADKRKLLTDLTPHGKAMMAARKAEMGTHFANTVAGLDPGQIGAAALVLRKMAASFDALDGEYRETSS